MSVSMPQIGADFLFCKRELSNEYDEHAAAINDFDHYKREEVFGHVPLFFSKTLKSSFTFPDRMRVANIQKQE